jgi:hypothetical protein
MAKYKVAVSMSLACLLLTGCATVQLNTGTITEPVSMTVNINQDFTVVKHFRRDTKGIFPLFHLVTTKNPDVEKIVAEELLAARGDAIVNLTIQGQTKLWDSAIPILFGMLADLFIYPYGSTFVAAFVGFRTYTIEGDVVRYIE